MIKFFEKYPEIIAAMSERKDGSMKLFKNESKNSENRQKFFASLDIDDKSVISAEIVHGTNAKVVFENDRGIIGETDGLVTNDKSVFLSITVADCFPVFFYDPENKIIGIAHAGWRGIIGGVLKNTLEEIFKLKGKPENMAVALGPGICKNHFEIKEDILDRFSDYPEFIIRKNQKIFVDLKSVMKKQLKEQGINADKIKDSAICTYESNNLFSWRRDKPKKIEAMVAVIGRV
jgi:YfiH family protein